MISSILLISEQIKLLNVEINFIDAVIGNHSMLNTQSLIWYDVGTMGEFEMKRHNDEKGYKNHHI